MPWSAKFTPPIALADGRKLLTLLDAADLALALPELHQRNAHWQYAGELLLAASDGGESEIATAREQMMRALKAERLIR